MANYVQEVVDELREEFRDLPPVADELLAIYAFLILTFRFDVSPLNVHDAWACWQNTLDRYHPSILQYEDLDKRKRLLDAPYVDGIIMVAKRMDWDR